MKRIIQGLVLATLISTAQASPFPGNGDPVAVAPEWTYAERNTGEGSMQLGSAIPGNGDPVSVPAASTNADRIAGEGNLQLGSSFPGNGDPVSVPAASTYADQFATVRAIEQAALSK